MQAGVKALVAYASRHGSTEEIAGAVAGILRSSRVATDVRSAAAVTDLSPYRAVVLGSALYSGHWLPAAVGFVERHAATLASLPVWVFSSGPLGRLTPEVLAQPDDSGELLGAILPEEHVVFPGRLDLDRLGLSERLMMRAVGAAAGDHRDWVIIERWAGEIAEAILAMP